MIFWRNIMSEKIYGLTTQRNVGAIIVTKPDVSVAKDEMLAITSVSNQLLWMDRNFKE